MREISTEEQVKELVKWLVNADFKYSTKGIFIDTKVRKMFMIDLQNKITKDGRVLDVLWENMGSGVYRCSLPIPLR